jgi:peptidoglycan/LPS O-acetylase OafA/YrhL
VGVGSARLGEYGVRLSFLDSIRGGASLIVVTSHLHYSARAETWFLETRGLSIFDQFVFAISIFFVLSGLVLYLQIEREKIGYLAFVVRRAFRIFPACIFAVTASYAIYVFWQPSAVAARGEWFNDVTWPPGTSFRSYLGHLWLGGSDTLLRPIWSLVIEWRISLVFPAIAYLFTRSPKLTLVGFGGVALSLAAVPATLVQNANFHSYIAVAFFSSFFVLGIFIAAYRLQIIFFVRRWPAVRYPLLAICIFDLCFRPVQDGLRNTLEQGVAGAMLIVLCMSWPKVRHVLRFPSMMYLGRISYSLYLVHMIWIGILFRVLDGTNPLVISALVVAVSILSADLMNRFIEVPANRFGKRVAGLIKLPSFLSDAPQPIANSSATLK